MRISVVVKISVCWRFSAAVTRSSPVTHGNNQLNPAPSKIARYVVIGLLPVVTSTTRPPTKNASSAVSTGASNPPAFCATS